MHVHRYEKLWFGAALLLIVLFIATVVFGAVGAGIQMIDDEAGTVDPSNLSEHPRFSETGVVESDDADTDYEVRIVAYHPTYAPTTVTVPVDSTITFYLTSGDVIHGFDMVGTNVNAMVIPGQVTSFTVEFDETGEYDFICNEYCGPQHHIMEGAVEVVSQEEWNSDGGGDS